MELHDQVLCYERGSDVGILTIGCNSQPVDQAQIVLDFTEGVEQRRPVSIFRLPIGRPGLLQSGATIPTPEDRSETAER